MKSEILLQVQNLRATLQTERGIMQVVDDISFSIGKGETFALLGESGSGKSMTALSIMRLLPGEIGRIASGRVMLAGQDLLQLPESAMGDVRGRKIAMIFQEPMTSLNPVLCVEDQVGEVLTRHLGLRGQSRRRRVIELLDAVGIPDAARRAQEYPHQFSGGMKQRVMIAMALACEPDLLIADEPTTALDVTIQAQVLDLLRKLQQKNGMAIFLITHDLGVVAEMADRVAVMYAGQLVELASRADFFSHPWHPYSRKLFDALPDQQKRAGRLASIPGFVPSLINLPAGCRFAPRCDQVMEVCQQTDPQWFRQQPLIAQTDVQMEAQSARCHLLSLGKAMVTADRSVLHSEKAKEQQEILLDVDGLKVHFPIRKGLFQRVVGAVKAVDGVSLRLRKGHTLALVGESGCGKTTVGKGILQLLPITAGSVSFEQQELTKIKGERLRKLRGGFQIVFQDPYSSMNPRMMVGDIIEEGMIAQNIEPNSAARKRRVAELLEQVGLAADVRNRYPHEFSGGQRQRVCIARALAVNPKLIVCDEPTSALDISVQAQVLNLLRDLQRQYHLSYLFITHNISVVSYLADDVAVMYLGRIVEQGSMVEVLDSPRHPYTLALLSAVPSIDPASKALRIRLEGDLPSPSNPPQGCHFHPRCPQAMDICKRDYPQQQQVSSSQRVACHLYSV